MSRILVLLALAAACSAVVADGDERPHPTLAQIAKLHTDHGHDELVVSRATLDGIAASLGCDLKPGFHLAAVELGASKYLVSADDVPSDKPLILLRGTWDAVAVYQDDQAAELADAEHCLQAQAVGEDHGWGIIVSARNDGLQQFADVR